MSKINLAWLDILIILSYIVLLVFIAIRARRKQKNTTDYFLGGHDIPFWAAGLSLLATALTAATFIGIPTSSYNGNLSFLAANIATIIAVLLVAFLFLPKYYARGVQTVYQYLTTCFGNQSALVASWMFLIGRTMTSGARLFVGAVAIAYILQHDAPHHATFETLIICLMVALAIIYAFWGGIRSVIWTDVAQAFLFIAAAIGAFLWLWSIIPLSTGEILSILHHSGENGTSKLVIFDASVKQFDPAHPYTLFAIILGVTLVNLGAYGTDQDLVQRMLTCKDQANGAKSILFSTLVNIPVVFLFLAIGLLLFVFYQHYETFTHQALNYDLDEKTRIFAQFIAFEVPNGLRGILLAGLLAAVVSSLTSELNAMSSTFVTDTYRYLLPNRSEKHYVTVGKLMTIVVGIALAGFASLCILLSKVSNLPVIDFVFSVMLYAYSGLLAAVLTALFTQRGNQVSVILGMLSGFFMITYLQFFSSLGQSLAFPWHMLISTTIAFIICCSGKRRVPLS